MFEEAGEGKTKLSIMYPKPETEEQFEAMKKSGMEEGWGQSLEKLADALKQAPLDSFASNGVNC